jgi:hypothetical protein
MPIGNGRLRGMAWGMVREERIDLNEDSCGRAAVSHGRGKLKV